MICDACKLLICEVEGCTRAAEYEGWISRGTMNMKIRVCPEHVYVTIGGQKELQNERNRTDSERTSAAD